MIDVVALGEILIDFAPVSTDTDGYPTLAAHPGGAPGNFLAALARYGCSTAMIGKVGDDAFGRLLRNTLQEKGIGVRGLIADADVFTTLAFVTLDETGNRSFSFARKPGADTQLRADEIPYDLIGEAKVFHFGTLSLTGEPARGATQQAVSFAKETGKLVSFDPNLRRPLWADLEEAKRQILWGLAQADVVKISDEEIDFLWGLSPEEGAQKLLDEFGVSLAFVTLGPKGCHAATKAVRVTVPSPAGVRVLDTTGAGDIFGGSAMSRLLASGKRPQALSREELLSIVRYACCAATLSTRTHGGISSVPDMQDVLSCMKAAY